MKTFIKFMFLSSVLCYCMSACKKESGPTTAALTSLNVTNAVVGGSALTLNNMALPVANNNSAQFSLIAGNTAIDLFPPTSPNTPYYNQSLSTANGSYYSLFLTGTSPTTIESVFLKESYQNYTDSLCGVRFINLAPGSSPISVNVKGQSYGSTIQHLAYKSYSAFLSLPAKKTNSSYVFEIRDAGTGNLIVSYTLSTPYFHNITLVLRGIVGGNPAATVLLDKDY